MGWDPRESSLFTGAGTPWGGKEYQPPAKPTYETDPSKVQGFDYTKLRQSMAQGIKQNRARTGQQQKMATFQANPYGGSSDVGRVKSSRKKPKPKSTFSTSDSSVIV